MIRLLYKLIVFFIAICIIPSLSSIVGHPVDPPKTSDVEAFYQIHKKELKILTDYLTEQNYVSVYIDSSDGGAWAEFNTIKIEDNDVIKSIESILRDGCKQIYMSTDRNSIEFLLWTRTRDEAAGGLLYALDPKKEPEVQFQTELVPLNEERWFYYLAEYNKWRIEHQTD